MNQDLVLITVVLGGMFGAAYLNEKYNLSNPDLERQLVGCWVGSTGSGKALSGIIAMQVNADNTFRESGVESLLNDPKAVTAMGTWKVQKEKWTLDYDQSSAIFLLPRAGRSLKLLVVEVTNDKIRAKVEHSQLPYEMARAPAQNGQCQVETSPPT